MKRMFVEVEVAELCYPIEAALWIALGRVPEFCFDGHGFDARGNTDAEANGYVISELRYFLESEFSLFGIDLNFQDYLNFVLGSSYYRSMEAAFAAKEEYRKLCQSINVPMTEDSQAPWDLGPEEIAEIRRIEALETKLKNAVERAKLDVMSAIMDGQLTCNGIPVPRELEVFDIDFENLSDATTIDPQNFGVSSIDWEEHSVLGTETKFLLSTIQTEELFKLFPQPKGTADLTDASIVGGTIILDENVTAKNVTRGRTASSMGFRQDIASVVRKEFLRRQSKRELPEKREAIYAEAIEWCDKILGEKVSRTTIRRHLAELFKSSK
jgi:hypothetical protein